MGIDPFGHAYERTHKSGQIREEFGELTKEELEEKNVTVKIAGRIMTKRRDVYKRQALKISSINSFDF